MFDNLHWAPDATLNTDVAGRGQMCDFEVAIYHQISFDQVLVKTATARQAGQLFSEAVFCTLEAYNLIKDYSK